MTHVQLNRSGQLSSVAKYAYSATVAPGALVFAAGACPLDSDGITVTPGDYAAQALRCMTNLLISLREVGAELTDVAKTTVYVASSNQADLVTAWKVIRGFMGEHDAPSTLLGVSCLGYPDQLVEVETVAALAP